MFHEQFGVYADGVNERTARAPDGWRDRPIRYTTPATNEVVAWCLSSFDLCVAKLIAGRQKDIEFIRALTEHGVVPVSEIVDGLQHCSTATPAEISGAERLISAITPTDP